MFLKSVQKLRLFQEWLIAEILQDESVVKGDRIIALYCYCEALEKINDSFLSPEA